MKRFSVLLLSIMMLLPSCSSTRPFTSGVSLRSDMSVPEKLEAYGGTYVSVDSPVMYFDGTAWLEDMVALVEEAEDYILLSTFLGSSAPTLEPLFKALEKKAAEGVRIYVVADGTSNLDMTESRFYMTPVAYLRAYGVKVLVYSPYSFSHVIQPAQLLVRDHRKMMVIDGAISAIGGMNINFISMGAGERCQRDSMYVFRSSGMAERIIEEFVSVWNEGSMDRISASDFAVAEDGGGEKYDAWIFNRNVYSGKVSIAGLYATLINSATESVFLCPYLPTVDERMTESLASAVGRGVDVEVWCSQDSRGYAKSGQIVAVEKLISESGITYYDVSRDTDGEEYPMYHMKMMVVDGRYLVVGSVNFNYRSMTLSHEIALVIDSPEIAAAAMEGAKESGGNPRLMTQDDAAAERKEYGVYPAYLFSYFGG